MLVNFCSPESVADSLLLFVALAPVTHVYYTTGTLLKVEILIFFSVSQLGFFAFLFKLKVQ